MTAWLILGVNIDDTATRSILKGEAKGDDRWGTPRQNEGPIRDRGTPDVRVVDRSLE